MEVVSRKKVNYRITSTGHICHVQVFHVKISDVDAKAKDMIETIQNTSWIAGMNIAAQTSFRAASKRTIDKFVNEILSNVDGEVGTEFGEIMISDTAQCILNTNVNHKKLPLADIFKERKSGNGGFDFHTESHLNRIVFGEAKYSGSSTKYKAALTQINEFISDEKDDAEIVTISHFVSESAVEAAVEGKKGYTAAFSLNCKNVTQVLDNALKSSEFKSLLYNEEVYLIGVEVCD